jgi:hypothetical protein
MKGSDVRMPRNFPTVTISGINEEPRGQVQRETKKVYILTFVELGTRACMLHSVVFSVIGTKKKEIHSRTQLIVMMVCTFVKTNYNILFGWQSWDLNSGFHPC